MIAVGGGGLGVDAAGVGATLAAVDETVQHARNVLTGAAVVPLLGVAADGVLAPEKVFAA